MSVVADADVDARLRRHDLADAEWVRVELLLPVHPRQGHRWSDHRMVINGVFHRVRAGGAWRDLPERFGPWQTVYNRHRRWSGDGTWERILSALMAGCDVEEGADWTVAVDSTIVRAHQDAAGARHRLPKDIDPDRLRPSLLRPASVPATTPACADVAEAGGSATAVTGGGVE